RPCAWRDPHSRVTADGHWASAALDRGVLLEVALVVAVDDVAHAGVPVLQVLLAPLHLLEHVRRDLLHQLLELQVSRLLLVSWIGRGAGGRVRAFGIAELFGVPVAAAARRCRRALRLAVALRRVARVAAVGAARALLVRVALLADGGAGAVALAGL